MMDEKEREQCLNKMKRTAYRFYESAVRTGNHAFIEFTGLINEYVNLCEQAHEKGEDFTTANVHLGKALPMHDFQARYLGEKFGCIFGPSFTPELFTKFVNQMDMAFDFGVLVGEVVQDEELPLPDVGAHKTLRQYVNRLCEMRGFEFKQLAHKARVDPITVRRWVDKETSPYEKTLAKIANALQVEPDLLIQATLVFDK